MVDFRRARAGEPLDIPARDWNRVCEAARSYYEGLGERFGKQPLPTSRQDLVWIRNDTGSDLDAWSVVGVDAPVFLPAENPDTFGRPVALKGGIPVLVQHLHRLAILIEPVVTNELGRAVMAGVTAAKVDVVDASHRYADVKDGVSNCLASSAAGTAQILWKEAGTGIKWAVVRMGAPAGRRLGIITVSVLQSGHQARWTYTIQPARWNDDGTDLVATAEPPITAINIIELRHAPEPPPEVSWVVWNTEAHMPRITLTPTPLSNGPIDYYTEVADSGLVHHFRGWGGFEGSCA